MPERSRFSGMHHEEKLHPWHYILYLFGHFNLWLPSFLSSCMVIHCRVTTFLIGMQPHFNQNKLGTHKVHTYLYVPNHSRSWKLHSNFWASYTRYLRKFFLPCWGCCPALQSMVQYRHWLQGNLVLPWILRYATDHSPIESPLQASVPAVYPIRLVF